MNDAQLQALVRLPAPQSCRVIDFDKAEVVVLESFPPQYLLVVSGTKPYLNMKVDLVPLVYIQQPDYWGIEVVGCLPGIGLPATAPYAISLPLTGHLGTAGIEVIGASEHQQIQVPPARPSSAGLLFSRDDRPVDGELREVKITPEDGSTFTAMLHTAYVDRINGHEIDQTEQLASGLTCTITDARVTCSRDDRAADGKLHELVVSRNDEGTFDATLRTAFFDRIDGRGVDETTNIGAGLTKR